MSSFRTDKPLPPAKRPPGPTTSSEIKASGSAAPDAPRIPFRALPHDRIAKRAYEIFVRRGDSPGNPDDDWFEAERQLRAGL